MHAHETRHLLGDNIMIEGTRVAVLISLTSATINPPPDYRRPLYCSGIASAEGANHIYLSSELLRARHGESVTNQTRFMRGDATPSCQRTKALDVTNTLFLQQAHAIQCPTPTTTPFDVSHRSYPPSDHCDAFHPANKQTYLQLFSQHAGGVHQHRAGRVPIHTDKTKQQSAHTKKQVQTGNTSCQKK